MARMRMHLRVMLIALLPIGLGGPVAAQERAPAAGEAQSVEAQEWQAVITSQLDAFRNEDGKRALNLAAQGFRQAYADPERFYADIVNSGYAPLVLSRSHSFGAWTRVGETLVTQVVRAVGPDQRIYEALYRLIREEEGWRIAAVLLQREAGLAV